MRHFFTPSLLLLTGLVPAAAVDLASVEMHGFVSQGYLQSTGNNAYAGTMDGTWAFSEVGLNATSQLTDNLRIGIQIFARDLGDVGNNDVTIDWAFADYHHNDYVGVRMGRYKTPGGLYNESRDLDFTSPYVLLPDSVYDIRWRDFSTALNGLQVYGTFPIGPIGKMDYQVFVGSMNVETDSYLGKTFQDTIVDELDAVGAQTVYGLALNWRPPVQGLRCMGSLMDIKGAYLIGTKDVFIPPMTTISIPIDTQIDDILIGTIGAELAYDQWTIAAEYLIRYANPPTVPNVDNRIRNDGGYVMCAYRINEHWEVGTYYSATYANRNDRDGDRITENPSVNLYTYDAWQKDLALTLRWDIDEAWIMKFEGHYINGVANLLNSENPQPYEQYWWLFAAKTTISF